MYIDATMGEPRADRWYKSSHIHVYRCYNGRAESGPLVQVITHMLQWESRERTVGTSHHTHATMGEPRADRWYKSSHIHVDATIGEPRADRWYKSSHIHVDATIGEPRADRWYKSSHIHVDATIGEPRADRWYKSSHIHVYRCYNRRAKSGPLVQVITHIHVDATMGEPWADRWYK